MDERRARTCAVCVCECDSWDVFVAGAKESA